MFESRSLVAWLHHFRTLFRPLKDQSFIYSRWGRRGISIATRVKGGGKGGSGDYRNITEPKGMIR